MIPPAKLLPVPGPVAPPLCVRAAGVPAPRRTGPGLPVVLPMLLRLLLLCVAGAWMVPVTGECRPLRLPVLLPLLLAAARDGDL